MAQRVRQQVEALLGDPAAPILQLSDEVSAQTAQCCAAEKPATPELGNWAAFAHFFNPKAVANGDKLGGMAENGIQSKRASGARF